MDRRIVLLAEPGPLVSRRLYHGSDDARVCGSTTMRQVLVDLRHLRGVLDDLSIFCSRSHEEKQNVTSIRSIGEGSGVNRREDKSVLPGKVGEGPPSLPGNDSTKAGGTRSRSRRVLLAAVFPCPGVLLEVEEAKNTVHDDGGEQHHQYEEQQQRRRLALASAFANALEECGVWHAPDEFETRVLVPTRTLINLQLEYLGDGQPPTDIDTASALCSGGPVGGNGRKRPRPSSLGSLSQHDDNVGATTSQFEPVAGEEADVVSAKAFVQSVADEITVLTRHASVEMDTSVQWSPGKEMGDEYEGGESYGHRPRLCMLDVLWAASSLSAEDDHDKPANASGQQLAATAPAATDVHAATREKPNDLACAAADAPTSARLPPPPPFTLSTAIDGPCSTPLWSALRETRTHFPRSCLTIWPALTPTPEPGESSSTSSRGTFGDGTGVCLFETAIDADGPQGIETPALSGGGALRLPRPRQWEAWCESTGARLSLSGRDFAATGAGAVLDPELLWRGAIVAGAARPMTQGPPPPGSSASSMAGLKLAPPQTARSSSDFPSLDGFALRIVAAITASPAKKPTEHDRHTGSNGSTAVAQAAASILGRAPALRLVRVISPGEVARGCHLLADGDLAPALELFVEDTERCPGSVEFLTEWAADGQGMLLVAELTEAAGSAARGRGGARKVAVEEGLAMACFPHCRRRSGSSQGLPGKGGEAVVGGAEEEHGGDARMMTATVWSVTLFRRPSEFSEAAVSALIGENSGNCHIGSALSADLARGGSCCGSALPMITTLTSRRSPGSDSTEGVKETAAASSIVASLPIFTSRSLLSQACGLITPPQETLSAARDDAPPSPSTPPSRKRRRAATSSVSGGSIGKRQALGAGALKAEVPCSTSPEKGARRRSRRIVKAAAAAEAETTPEELELPPSVTKEATAMAAQERKLNAVMDAWAARQSAVWELGQGRSALPTERQTRVGANSGARNGGKTWLPSDEVPVGDRGCRGVFPSSSLAYSVYGSFGDWGVQEGNPGVEGQSRRQFWAEECLLPDNGCGDGGYSSSGRMTLSNGSGSRNRSTSVASIAACAATAAAAATTGVGGASVSEGDRRRVWLRKSNGVSVGCDGDGGVLDEAEHATLQESGLTGYNSDGCGLGGAAAPPPPLRRALSTAEEVLEKAGQQQRARVKERRAVAREQRTRMDRPRPRPHPRPSSGTGTGGGGAASLSSSRVAGVVGGGGSGAFRRRGSSSGAPPLTLGAMGRSNSLGSKLSRGSRILGQSVATGASVMGASASSGSGVGGGSSGARTGGGAGGGGATTSSGGGGRQQEPAATLSGVRSVVGTTVGSGVGGTGGAGVNRERAQSIASSSSSSSSAAATGGPAGRVRRAIFQDPPPRAVASSTATIGRTEGGMGKATERSTTEAGGGSTVGRNNAGAGSMAGFGDGGKGHHSMIRQAMERAMLAAVAAQLGLPEDSPSVREVFERESRLMGSDGGAAAAAAAE